MPRTSRRIIHRRGKHSYINPLFTRKTWRHYVIERFSLFGWLVLLLLLFIIYGIFYSPLLEITRVEITGLAPADAKIIEREVVLWQLQQRRLGVLPQDNILIFSKNWLRQNIGERYDPQSITIDKQLPHTLILVVTKHAPFAIWQTKNDFYYIEQSGVLSARVDDIDSQTLPRIGDESGEAVQPGTLVMNGTKASFFHSLVERLADNPDYTPTFYHTPHQFSPRINVDTVQGFAIYFDSSKDLDAQLTKLQRVFDKTLRETPPIEYVDVRLGERVYYK